jgi:hypothetical protein
MEIWVEWSFLISYLGWLKTNYVIHPIFVEVIILLLYFNFACRGCHRLLFWDSFSLLFRKVLGQTVQIKISKLGWTCIEWRKRAVFFVLVVLYIDSSHIHVIIHRLLLLQRRFSLHLRDPLINFLSWYNRRRFKSMFVLTVLYDW